MSVSANSKTIPSATARHDENNLASAREILDQPDAFGGEDSGLVKWARAVMARLQGKNTGHRGAKTQTLEEIA